MFTLIESLEDLSYLNKEISDRSHIGIDTEFRRTSKYNMKLALLQINDGEEIFLIDTIKIKHPESNIDFLSSGHVIKIFHSCKEDLEAILSWTDSKIENVFDTQIANAFLGEAYSISYQDLVKDRLGIVLDKKRD